ncbi:MAG: hypothetical protein PHV30_08645 [Candidatus Margulisbacteria bacterium]|nr:hypothetical protein [Candidatus Margulisiibacteriota bacterium]
MEDEILSCKHGIYKETCVYCKDLDSKLVIKEKENSLTKRNWHSSSYFDNSAHNSASGDQEYDLEEDFVEYDTDTDVE